jgi:hypothetical protein
MLVSITSLNLGVKVPLSDPGAWDCTYGILLLGYGMGHDPRSTSIVTTHNAVGLLIE